MGNEKLFEDFVYKSIEENMDTTITLLEQKKKKIFSDIDLGEVLNQYNYIMNIDEYSFLKIRRSLFITVLIKLKIIQKIPIECSERNINRYLFKDSNTYEKALSLHSNSYLSHYTAVFLHDITLNVPKIIYTNIKEYKKPNKTQQSELKQINIDKAFSREFRKSNNIAYLKKQPNDIKVVMLNSKYMNNSNLDYLSVEESLLPVTSIERTLIDIVVRPEYSGGVSEVINIFKNSIDKVSIGKLISILNDSDYIYPYHQSLGFYLDLAGFSEDTLKQFDNYDFKYNFYLNYKMIDPLFSKRWKVYYPNYINY